MHAGAAALIAAVLACDANAAPRYVAKPLGTLGGSYSYANGINNRGQVAGWSYLGGDAFRHAFVHSGGSMHDLGTLGGSESWGNAINASGWVTGAAAKADGMMRAFLYSAGTMTDLGSLGGNVYPSEGLGINDRGEVTGWSVRTDFQYVGADAFLYSGGSMTSISSGVGRGINARGEIAGYSGGGGHFYNPERPFVYSQGRLQPIDVIGAALAINASGQVTGTAAAGNDGSRHAFVYANGVMSDLVALGFVTVGLAINGPGRIVGSSSDAATSRAFLYADGEMHDLNALVYNSPLPIPLTAATGINDLGQIVANGCGPALPPFSLIRCHAYRLDPVADPPAVVEFYNASLGHYFITHVLSEIALLDEGTTIRGWARTGQSFKVFVAPSVGTSPVCRLYIPPAQGDSHFYGRGDAECTATLSDHPSFVNEDAAFFRVVLPAGGQCVAGTRPVYRVFNNRPDANHRYLTDRSLREQMIAGGWVAEGDGPDGVAMCVPD